MDSITADESMGQDATRAGGGLCVCVILTHDRPALLALCLAAVRGQAVRPGVILVVDNGSGAETRLLLAGERDIEVMRLAENVGGAGGFQAGIARALILGADWVWLMDDDGRPAGPECLGMLTAAASVGADLVGPLVLDVDAPERLAFPIRIGGRTRFSAGVVRAAGSVEGFAHLFNGTLIAAGLFWRIGLPESRFVIRGDEVEFLLRARRAGARVVLETGAAFLHPGSGAEIHPILGGLFYAVVPRERTKRFYQFRNRAFIFRHYGMWVWLAADVVRYGAHFLLGRTVDVAGFRAWVAATRAGLSGAFMREPPHGPAQSWTGETIGADAAGDAGVGCGALRGAE